ncbi:thioredoxin domain-containing protein (plasmid) [Methylobacterium currus]|uniref:thioredoxin family protein n=1 Tax=Methylobacterium currus TaxID=2051553 RepID=UPI001E3DF66D|nr:thioredoxin domain-containing protein [Methylobacterium currus]UHC19949.1 thioredoxin domain-containing protein [Methylobacterium currus]
MTIPAITDATFQAEVLEAATPVLLKLWAPWCGPCRAMSPVVDEIAAEYAGEIAVRAVEVDGNPGIAERLAMRSIPLLVLFRDGREVGRAAGLQSKTRICAFLDGHLDPAG